MKIAKPFGCPRSTAGRAALVDTISIRPACSIGSAAPTPAWIAAPLVVLLAAPFAAAVGAHAPTPEPDRNFAGDLQQLLHAHEQQRQQDPIGALSGDMSVITDELATDQTDEPVQTQQKQVVSRLDQLIAQLNQQCNGNGGMSNNPTKPMSDSRIVKGPGGSGPMHDPQVGTKQWGQLPPKERAKILQSQNDGFPAGYESLLSNYYSRLAQEQVAGAPPASPADASSPADGSSASGAAPASTPATQPAGAR